MHLGTQTGVFTILQTSAVPIEYPFFPERLAKFGYNRYMVGKWHLGYCKHDYLPTKRGFEKFFGYYGGAENYYTHKEDTHIDKTKYKGVDFFHDTEASFSNKWHKKDKYSTEVFANETIALLEEQNKEKPFYIYLAFQAVHAPLQPPPSKYLSAKCSNITRKERRIYCGMVHALDSAVGKVVAKLKDLDMYNNTIIIFSSDNGGETAQGGNNYPLRGNKNTLWEGGTRINSFVHSPANIQEHAVRKQMFHVVDWYATILGMAGSHMNTYGDGINQWDMIKNNSKANNRRRFVYNVEADRAAIRDGDYKLITGKPGEPDGWIPPQKKSSHSPKSKNQTAWLFNIKADPNERHDLSVKKPSILHKMMLKLRRWSVTAVPSVRQSADPRGDPKHFNGTFASGWC
uniref:Sulfatase N-terminal domain-containing protein n=1 Tax=Plectus sambesii TaxID=2011161 RepID=A0A914XKR1_9BILA